jgi:hypothetical protein
MRNLVVREQARGRLIQHRAKQMVVSPVNERDTYGNAS